MYKVVDYYEFIKALQEKKPNIDKAIELVTCAPQIPEHIIKQLQEEKIL